MKTVWLDMEGVLVGKANAMLVMKPRRADQAGQGYARHQAAIDLGLVLGRHRKAGPNFRMVFMEYEYRLAWGLTASVGLDPKR